MNSTAPTAGAGGPATAGGLLRAARERHGLHIAALAASIKVTPRKLEALEADRYDELPDATFTRALAQTVCRFLKVDPQPVLALLPQADAGRLDRVGGSLNTPFRARPGGSGPAGLAVAAVRPLAWAGAALLLAAVVVYFLPSGLWDPTVDTPAAAAPAAASAAVAAPAAGPATPPGAEPSATVSTAPAAAASTAVIETVFSAPPLAVAGASAASSAAPGPLVQLRADEASWVEVRDGRGQVLLSRVLQPSESVGFDGALPLRLTIGNAAATRLRFRGTVIDLPSTTRDNVARLELQ